MERGSRAIELCQKVTTAIRAPIELFTAPASGIAPDDRCGVDREREREKGRKRERVSPLENQQKYLCANFAANDAVARRKENEELI